MDNGNKTALANCRFLSDEHFHELYDAFIEAFSDYVFPFVLTEQQFRNHILLNAVDLARTIACIENGRIVGFSLNGFGDWKGLPTVYDAGTGVLPTHRRQGLSDRMFEMMLPVFRESGISQCLLEVVTSNDAAINLYKKLGYGIDRELALLQCDKEIVTSSYPSPDVDIREIEEPEWELFETFWDGMPSWQNSTDAMKRSGSLKHYLGAFIGGECVGYVIFSLNFGRIAQMAVRRENRGQGIGTSLLQAVQRETADGFSMQVINIDKSPTPAIGFFTNRGFYERVSQYEMTKQM